MIDHNLILVFSVEMMFQAYAIEWFRRREIAGFRSVCDYESMLRNHLLPTWSRSKLEDIRPVTVRNWVADLRTQNLAPRTIRKIYGLLRNIMADAITDELIIVNPCCLRGTSLPPNEHKEPDFRERHVFTREEMLQIVNQPDIPTRWRTLYITQFATGLRIGETLALTWGDIDLESDVPTIRVSKSYNSKTNLVGPTKTKVGQKIPIHSRLVDAFDEWRLKYPRIVKEAPNGDRLVFPAPLGKTAKKHLRSSVVLHHFQKDLKKLGLSRRRIHDTRRTFITLACNTEGADTDILRRVTHARKSDVHDGYREIPIEVIARELRKLDLGDTMDKQDLSTDIENMCGSADRIRGENDR